MSRPSSSQILPNETACHAHPGCPHILTISVPSSPSTSAPYDTTSTTQLLPQADVISDIHTEANGSFILNSGAHPTHLNTPTPTMPQLTKPLQTHTALNRKRPCSHHGMLQIRRHRSKYTINKYTVVNRHLRHTLLSVTDLAQRYRLVYYTSHYEYIANTHSMPPKLLSRATGTNSQYEVTGTIPDGARPYTFRSLTYKRPKLSKTQTTIFLPPHPQRTKQKQPFCLQSPPLCLATQTSLPATPNLCIISHTPTDRLPTIPSRSKHTSGT